MHAMSDTVTVFVSGHLDLSSEEFRQHYAPSLREHIDAGSRFVVGDARGADTMTQRLLAFAGCDDNVTVFHMLAAPRNNIGFSAVGGFASDEERDEAMTLASDVDIAWVRPGRENSGTARNLARRSTR